jgi:hypothetical protein
MVFARLAILDSLAFTGPQQAILVGMEETEGFQPSNRPCWLSPIGRRPVTVEDTDQTNDAFQLRLLAPCWSVETRK